MLNERDPCQRRSLTFYSFAPRSVSAATAPPPSVIPFTFPSRPSCVSAFSPKCQCHFRGAVARPPALQRRLVMTDPDARGPVNILVHVI